MSGDPDSTLFAPPGGFSVNIRDLSGGNGAEPVETVRNFPTLLQANAFARRYVRDSLERCRAPKLTPDEVLAAWFAFGEDAEVVGAESQGWSSGAEIRGFAEQPCRDAEERNWRVLDPRRQEEEGEDEAEDEA
jgi:hypothetical protein